MTLLDSPKARRAALLDQLHEEIAVGWPKPWWKTDAQSAEVAAPAGLTPVQEVQLHMYLDIVTDVLEGVPYGQHGEYGAVYHRNERKRELRAKSALSDTTEGAP